MKTTTNKKLHLAGIMMSVFVIGMSMSFMQYKQDDKKPWVVPEKFKMMKNPMKPDSESLASGKSLYNKHCKSCHGTKGLGDGPKAKELDTPSGDFSTKEFQSQTDGEIFYKMKEGRDDMPTFKKKITDDEDIWMIINFVRILGENKAME